jgi:DNA-binding response OmpR family regulator
MNTKEVYILEDDPDISELLTYILSNAGYKIHQFTTAKQFNAILITQLPDLFVLDIMLPDGDGMDICRKLKLDTRTSGIPVLLMSANKSRKEVITESYAEDFISKPFDIDYFKERVDHYMQS